MANHHSLKPNLLQAETQKNSKKQPSKTAIPKKNGKETFDLLPSANMENQISTFKN
jgi:hypothetical protein